MPVWFPPSLKHAPRTMPEPYASVVIPSHDRHSTLDVTLASIQAQTVRDIEIIVALDGATDAVRALARGIAAQDERVIVLDMPKGPGRGTANCAAAVRSVRSERVFYSDDDDLWFPDHVATLGAALDDHDVAYTPTLSLSLSGTLHLGFVDYSMPGPRSLLSQGTLKTVYDTHLAHRKSTYLEAGNPWSRSQETDRGVLNLLTALAAASPRWKALHRITAISVHGAPRKKFSPANRRAELEAQTSSVLTADREQLTASCSVEWYLQRCFRDLEAHLPVGSNQGVPASVDTFLARIGVGHTTQSGVDSTAILPLSDEQYEVAKTLFALWQGCVDRSEILAEMLPNLMDPILGSRPHLIPLAAQMEKAIGLSEAIAFVATVQHPHPQKAELCNLLHGRLLSRARRFHECMDVISAIDVAHRHYPGIALQELANASIRLGRRDDCADFTRRFVETDPTSIKAWNYFVRTFLRLGDIGTAREGMGRLLQLTQDPLEITPLDELFKRAGSNAMQKPVASQR